MRCLFMTNIESRALPCRIIVHSEPEGLVGNALPARLAIHWTLGLGSTLTFQKDKSKDMGQPPKPQLISFQTSLLDSLPCVVTSCNSFRHCCRRELPFCYCSKQLPRGFRKKEGLSASSSWEKAPAGVLFFPLVSAVPGLISTSFCMLWSLPLVLGPGKLGHDREKRSPRFCKVQGPPAPFTSSRFKAWTFFIERHFYSIQHIEEGFTTRGKGASAEYACLAANLQNGGLVINEQVSIRSAERLLMFGFSPER